MKCEIAYVTAILVLNTVAYAQFNPENLIRVNITLTNSSNNLETAFTNLRVQFNRSAVYMLILNDVYMQNENNIFNEHHFREFSSLTILHLQNGKIDVFPNSTFVNWNNFEFQCLYKTLNLINIGLKSISKYLLEPISRLNILNASHNELTYLANDVFENSTYLSALNLSYNKLNLWSGDILRPIECLRELILNNNNIASLNENMFSSQKTNLMKLDLSYNDIQRLGGKVFAGMVNLTELIISHTFSPNLAQLPPKMFENMSQLYSLQADLNNFQHLPDDIFSDLKKLQILDLSSNNIKYLNPNIFENNHRLSSLNLDSNKLTYLNDSLFLNLIELKYLNLANNLLTFSYETEIFSPLLQLNILILDNNKEVQMAYDGSKSVLYNCNQTQHISARYTNVTEIYTDWHSLQYLRLLDLTNTSVGKIQANYTFQSGNAHLMLTGSSNEFLVLGKGKMISPNEEAGRKLIFDKKQNCDPNCSCVFSILYQNEGIIRLHCSRFDRRELRPEIPSIIKAYSRRLKIEFILNNCGALDFQQLVSYLKQIGPGYVTKLGLSNTGLRSINDLNGDYLSQLEVLELNDNNFTSLEPDIVEQLRSSPALKKITLHGNNWTCNCESKEFIKFVKQPKENLQIPNIENVLCSDGSRVDEYDEEVCDTPRNNGFIYIGWSLVIFIAGSSIAITLYHRYKFYIKCFMFKYRKYLPECFFPDEGSIDEDKIYDAFVIYAKDDEAFVKTRLVPALENQEPKLKLCIHLRDWIIGDRINDQIHRSIKSSRRTLVVLSHNFLNSEWCKLEFKTARDRAIQDRVNRLVVIMLEDIATHRLNEDLKAYITRYTYIPWQDNDWFWNKLRYALPHVRRTNIETDDRNENSSEERRQMIQLMQKSNCGKSLNSLTE